MAGEMRVSKLEAKSHDAPDEVRSPQKTKVEVVRLKEFTLGRFKLDPGWKWSDCIKPVVKTESCQVSHVGHCVSGRIKVKLNDGTETTIAPGSRTRFRPVTTPGWKGASPSSASRL
jgi:hypothetical protein